MKKKYTFDELYPNKEKLEMLVTELETNREAKNKELARQTLYSEKAVSELIKHMQSKDKSFKLLTDSIQPHPWEHDIKAIFANKSEKIDVKSIDGDDYWKKGFAINFVWEYAEHTEECPTMYFGVSVSNIDKTVEIIYYQNAETIKEFCEKNYNAYSKLSRPRAGKDGKKRWCLVPYIEWRKL